MTLLITPFCFVTGDGKLSRFFFQMFACSNHDGCRMLHSHSHYVVNILVVVIASILIVNIPKGSVIVNIVVFKGHVLPRGGIDDKDDNGWQCTTNAETDSDDE